MSWTAQRDWNDGLGQQFSSHPQAFAWRGRGTLVCDDFSGYKALFDKGVTEVDCLANVSELRGA
ncbi:transposase [Paraburkholderia nodosa]|uniref:transposase n=1 Tax=Paraburkholderia nodosa TaxID=392320 RepID=UPI000484EF67|nr:transposase [Paraburkholderia nodosa]